MTDRNAEQRAIMVRAAELEAARQAALERGGWRRFGEIERAV